MKPFQIIDPHVHLFNLLEGDYFWLREGNPPFWPDKAQIAKTYNEEDLSLDESHTLTGFVHIEAGFDNAHPWREIDWLDDSVSLPFRAVAGINLLNENFDDNLKQLLDRPKVVGVRNILDEQAVTILNNKHVQRHLDRLAEHGLSFDAQLAIADLPSFNVFIQTVKAHPDLVFIINHGGWPPIDPVEYKLWHQNMERLAECNNVVVKLSGWEMANRHWVLENVMTIAKEVLLLFGNERVMLASNFPLSTWNCSYSTYWTHWINALRGEFGGAVCEQLVNNNAKQFYKL